MSSLCGVLVTSMMTHEPVYM